MRGPYASPSEPSTLRLKVRPTEEDSQPRCRSRDGSGSASTSGSRHHGSRGRRTGGVGATLPPFRWTRSDPDARVPAPHRAPRPRIDPGLPPPAPTLPLAAGPAAPVGPQGPLAPTAPLARGPSSRTPALNPLNPPRPSKPALSHGPRFPLQAYFRLPERPPPRAKAQRAFRAWGRVSWVSSPTALTVAEGLLPNQDDPRWGSTSLSDPAPNMKPPQTKD